VLLQGSDAEAAQGADSIEVALGPTGRALALWSGESGTWVAPIP
jgi:hypothetical protein